MASISAIDLWLQVVHVLLVEPNVPDLPNALSVLQECQYRVTTVGLASAAISMITYGNARFDVLVANIISPDLRSYQLLDLAVGIHLPVILMSTEYNIPMAVESVKAGAMFHVQKPLTVGFVKLLRQIVFRERLLRNRANVSGIGNANNGEGANNEAKEKKKARMEWTDELHGKFVDVVRELGEGRCFPADILERMNVPGLTRMQVASHLQKCRNDGRAEERRRMVQAQLNGPQQVHHQGPVLNMVHNPKANGGEESYSFPEDMNSVVYDLFGTGNSGDTGDDDAVDSGSAKKKKRDGE